MRLILEFLDGLFLSKKREKIQIDSNFTIDQLFKVASQKLEKKEKEINLKFKRDGFTLKLIRGWSADFYEIKENSIIHAEIQESHEEKQRKQSEHINVKYMQKLFPQSHIPIKLSDIKEDDEKNIDEESYNDLSSEGYSPDKKKRRGSSDHNLSFESEDNQYKQNQKEQENHLKLLNFSKMCELQLEKFLKLTQRGNIEDLTEYLDYNIPQEFTDEQKQQYLENKQKIINQNGSGGWNGLHFAIFQNQIKIVQLFLNKKANPNKITADGFTCLQLAIYKKNVEIVQLLLQQPNLHINETTIKGTALHIACKLGLPEILNLLLTHGADLDIQNEQQITPIKMCQNEQCMKIIQIFIQSNRSVVTFKNQLQKQEEADKKFEEEKKKLESLSELEKLCLKLKIFVPPKPQQVIGKVYKLGNMMFSKSERFLLLDINQGSFIRFKSKKQYPNKPNQVIPLLDIQNIQIIQPNVVMDKNNTYFEVLFDQRLVFGCKTKIAAKLWVQYIYKAVCYAQFLQNLEKRNVDLSNYVENIEETIEIKDDDQQDKLIWEHVKKQLQIEEDLKKEQENNQKLNDQLEEKKLKEKDNWIVAKPNGIENSDKPGNSKKGSQEISDGKESDNDSTNSQKINKKPKLPDINDKNNSKIPVGDQEIEDQINNLSNDFVNFDSFIIIKILGQGAFGKVFLVQKKDNQKLYAMKALKKRNLILKKQLRFAVTEANVLKSVNHVFVMGLHYAFQTPQYLYLVMDFCPGGDLAQHIMTKNTLDEKSAKFYIAELVLAIESLHKKNVIYRDLKPENVLIASDGHIKLADFGLSKENVGKGVQASTFCGTPAYLSPEMVVTKRASSMSDIYGIGCCLYEMLAGDPPFYSDDIPTMYKSIKEQTLKFPSNISKTTKEFLKKILEKNPQKRLGYKGFDEIKNDPYFKDIDFQKLLNKEVEPPITDFDEEEDELNNVFANGQMRGKAIFRDQDYNENNARVNRVVKFTFAR